MTPWGFVTEAISGAFRSWLASRTRRAELEDAKHQRRVQVVQEGRVNEATWNQKAIENAGWKDDWLTILFSIPLVLFFFPGAVPHLTAGFDALSQAPDWYIGAFSLMVASAFGYQKFHHWQMSKHYSLPDQEPDI